MIFFINLTKYNCVSTVCIIWVWVRLIANSLLLVWMRHWMN